MRAFIHRLPPLGQAVAIFAICLVTVWLIDAAFSLASGGPVSFRIGMLGAPIGMSVWAYVQAVRRPRV